MNDINRLAQFPSKLSISFPLCFLRGFLLLWKKPANLERWNWYRSTEDFHLKTNLVHTLYQVQKYGITHWKVRRDVAAVRAQALRSTQNEKNLVQDAIGGLHILHFHGENCLMYLECWHIVFHALVDWFVKSMFIINWWCITTRDCTSCRWSSTHIPWGHVDTWKEWWTSYQHHASRNKRENQQAEYEDDEAGAGDGGQSNSPVGFLESSKLHSLTVFGQKWFKIQFCSLMWNTCFVLSGGEALLC